MKILFLASYILLSLIGFCAGVLLLLKPALALELQRRFYFSINWKIEPVSLEKELRNTKFMGVFLIILMLGSLIFLLPRLYLAL